MPFGSRLPIWRSALSSLPISLKLGDHGDPVNEKHAERRAATWLYLYCTGDLPSGSRTLNHGSARSTDTRNLLMRADSPFGIIREAAESLIPAINIDFMCGWQVES